MQSFSDAFLLAGGLIVGLDAELYEIIALSLRVSLTATLLALLIGLPIGAFLATTRFRGRAAALVMLNALMGLPPVVVGVVLYLQFSRFGPLGFLGLLYTPTAMIVAQTVLITPIVAALSRQILEDLHRAYDETLRSLAASRLQRVGAVLWDARGALVTVGLAGFGRAIAEVGAVMIVGGNIQNRTRVMTTAISEETSKGELAFAVALGLVLLVLALGVTAAAAAMKGALGRETGHA